MVSGSGSEHVVELQRRELVEASIVPSGLTGHLRRDGVGVVFERDLEGVPWPLQGVTEGASVGFLAPEVRLPRVEVEVRDSVGVPLRREEAVSEHLRSPGQGRVPLSFVLVGLQLYPDLEESVGEPLLSPRPVPAPNEPPPPLRDQ